MLTNRWYVASAPPSSVSTSVPPSRTWTVSIAANPTRSTHTTPGARGSVICRNTGPTESTSRRKKYDPRPPKSHPGIAHRVGALPKDAHVSHPLRKNENAAVGDSR